MAADERAESGRAIQQSLDGDERELADLYCQMPYCENDATHVVKLRANVGTKAACDTCTDEYLEFGSREDVREIRTEDRMGVTGLVE